MKTATPDKEPNPEFDQLLRAAGSGDLEACKAFWTENYDLFRKLASGWLQKSWVPGQISLTGTQIVHELWTRMHCRLEAMRDGKRLFFAAFYTECMRVTVEHYRQSRRRPGSLPDEVLALGPGHGVDYERLQQRLLDILANDPEQATIAMMKVFERRCDTRQAEGWRAVTNEEVAKELGISLRTVEAKWARAKARIMRDISEGGQAS